LFPLFFFFVHRGLKKKSRQKAKKKDNRNYIIAILVVFPTTEPMHPLFPPYFIEYNFIPFIQTNNYFYFLSSTSIFFNSTSILDMPKGTAEKTPDVITRVCTINLHKRMVKAGNRKSIGFKKRAPRAIREIKKFATQMMNTKDVRVDTELNKFIWSKGVRNIPYRVRVKLSRRMNDDEEADEKLYTFAQLVPVPAGGFKGLLNETVQGEADEE
tara:strand:- start:280 stop:918 length:639 start_codon:yes stop_codon:yes gene_type:complete